MNSKLITKDSFFHKRLQQAIANTLFPTGSGDWYKIKGYGTATKRPFNDFIIKQTSDKNAQYHEAFQDLDLTLGLISSKLCNGDQCKLEVLKCAPTAVTNKPGIGKHIIYFPGANTYYQACFRDISTAAKETGATIHAFNFPGTGLSSGKVREANDLINSGLSIVSSLIGQGISPDDIILQGDCYGAGIALEVKQQLEQQASIKVRLIMNNAFKSFKAVICDMITDTLWLPNVLKNLVKKLLLFTGWHITPGKKYQHADPYQCHIQHLGDTILQTSTLSTKVQKYHEEIKTGLTKSINDRVATS